MLDSRRTRLTILEHERLTLKGKRLPPSQLRFVAVPKDERRILAPLLRRNEHELDLLDFSIQPLRSSDALPASDCTLEDLAVDDEDGAAGNVERGVNEESCCQKNFRGCLTKCA